VSIFEVLFYMILSCVVVADDDELTFDPGEVITNIEFVSVTS